ncbi:glutaminyl-peptide cyclotransferase isoform X1 [Musca domestica]|uniref:glutaminyl-peptide cyclotransferase n=1 Tax=Musca domestica TaxID=7370 RepID=A0A9J7I677_MUSDO|nr:glutaminyl-peptide cyclotransferase isoform X1 [Musca domestica]
MRLIHNLRQYSKSYGQLLEQVRENCPSFLQDLLPTKRKFIYNLGAAFEVQDLQPYHVEELSHSHFHEVAHLSNVKHLKHSVKEILIPRIVGTPGHEKVRIFIVQSLEDLKWSVKLHSFHETVPILGHLHFHNIVATLNPNAERYLVLACHYDSKYMEGTEFLGATDSAVPCAMMLNLAKVLEQQLEQFRNTELSLMFIFFDGEEAFKEWSAKDSIYGARHLARKWEKEGFLPKLDLLVLLDLLGMPDPKFYSFFSNTESWYSRLLNIEDRLADTGLMERYVSSGVSRPQDPNRYFQPNALRSSFIEDDHIPFLRRNVPVLHIIPVPFPTVWHTPDDNETIIDYSTTENLARIIRLFTLEYLMGTVSEIDKDWIK